MRFLPLKIVFFWVFENDKSFRSEPYMVSKNRISPQRKLGSLRNLRLFLKRHEVIDNFFSRKDPCLYTCAQAVNARVHDLP